MRSRVLLAVLVIALGAGVLWVALRGAHERSLEPQQPVPAAAEEARAAAELAVPAGQPSTDTRAAVAGGIPRGIGEVEILDAAGAPLAGARWIVFRGDELIANGTTAEDGRASFGRDSGSAELAVLAPGLFLQRLPLDLAAERQTVRLAATAAVAGRVEVDGREPVEPVQLVLTGDVPLPGPVFEGLGKDARAGQTLQGASAAGGAFRIDGLPAGWSGTITWRGKLYLLRDQTPEKPAFGHRRLPVTAPREDLLLELTAGARLTGTVVAPATGAGIKALVRANMFQGEHGQTRQGQTEEDGRFSYDFPHALPDRVELRVSMPGGAGARNASFDLPSGVQAHDLGLIPILPVRTIAFEVSDEEQRPIQGAKVFALPEDGASATSDAGGLGSLLVSSEAQGLRVSDPRYEPAEVPLPSGDEPAAIVLRRGTVLEVRMAPGLGVELRGPEPPFLRGGAPSWNPEARDWSTISNEGPLGFISIYGEKDGVYVLGLRPGVELELKAVDRFGAIVEKTAVAPLERGEWRVVELALGATLRTLAGRVVDAEGAPVSKATVKCGAFGPNWFGPARTSAEGRFRLEGLCAESICLSVSAEGYATLVIEDQRVTDEPLELVLERGRTVRVSVVGQDGRLMPGATVFARSASVDSAYTRESPSLGVYELKHIPSAACTLGIYAGGEELLRPLPADVTEARVEVPSWRALHVRAEGWGDLPFSEGSYVALRSLDGEPRRLDQSRAKVGDGEVRVDVVYPGRYEAFVARRTETVDAEQRLGPAVEIIVATDASGAPLEVTLTLDAPK